MESRVGGGDGWGWVGWGENGDNCPSTTIKKKTDTVDYIKKKKNLPIESFKIYPHFK